LCGDAHAIASLAHAALHLITHSEITGDVSWICGLVLVGEDGVPRNYGQRGKPAERVDNILRHTIGEIIALWIGVLVLEWKYGNRGFRLESDASRELIACV
jgi:hypothetical protein